MNAEKWLRLAHILRAGLGIATGATILTENHPYWSLLLMIKAAMVNEYIIFVKDSKLKSIDKTEDNEDNAI